jgi:hypothetical protein
MYAIVEGTEDVRPTYHEPDERGANEPFHPVSKCGLVLSRTIVDEVPEGYDTCGSCSGKSSAKKKTDDD